MTQTENNQTEQETSIDVEMLQTQLTNKNSDYIFKLKKALTQEGQDEAQQQAILEKLLPEIITAQQKGQPATQLYGPVNQKVAALLNAPKKPKKVSFKIQVADNAAIFLIMYLAISGLFAFFAKSKAAQGVGITSTIVTAALAGLIMTYPTIYAQMPKDKRPAFWKMILVVISLSIAFMLVYGLTIFIPRGLNPVLPPIVNLILAAVGFLIRWYLKRRYHYSGTLF